VWFAGTGRLHPDIEHVLDPDASTAGAAEVVVE
jgi:hypothetical protein